MDSFLLWADTQRRTSLENVWKAQALQNFTREEITDAKALLWDVCDVNIIGKMQSHKGTSKQVLEIDDINIALKKLPEKEALPLFIGTSNMFLRTSKAEDTSDEESTTLKYTKNGVNECCDYIKEHAINGVVLNGLLLWADIQRCITPENIWKNQAQKKFLKEEITEAKETLWKIYGEPVI